MLGLPQNLSVRRPRNLLKQEGAQPQTPGHGPQDCQLFLHSSQPAPPSGGFSHTPMHDRKGFTGATNNWLIMHTVTAYSRAECQQAVYIKKEGKKEPEKQKLSFFRETHGFQTPPTPHSLNTVWLPNVPAGCLPATAPRCVSLGSRLPRVRNFKERGRAVRDASCW